MSIKESGGIWNTSADFQQIIFKTSAEVLKYLRKMYPKIKYFLTSTSEIRTHFRNVRISLKNLQIFDDIS